jgi:hypothetical protein
VPIGGLSILEPGQSAPVNLIVILLLVKYGKKDDMGVTGFRIQGERVWRCLDAVPP